MTSWNRDFGFLTVRIAVVHKVDGNAFCLAGSAEHRCKGDGGGDPGERHWNERFWGDSVVVDVKHARRLSSRLVIWCGGLR